MSPPVHIFSVWEQIERRIDRAPGLALFSDFDGTLVRIQRNPANVQLSQRFRNRLSGLQKAGVTVGIASGRAIRDVCSRVGLKGIWYVGAHGYFLRDPQNREFSLLSSQEQARMKNVIHALAVQLRGLVGISLEAKDASIAIHYREASKQTREQAWNAVSQLMNHDHLHLMAGKRVWELLPTSKVNKWTGIRVALKRAARGRGRAPLLIFVGDDVTDEKVFERMSGIGIVVGRRRKTAAQFYVQSPAEVGVFLDKVARCIQ